MENRIKNEIEKFVKNTVDEFIKNGNLYEYNEDDYSSIAELKNGIGIIVRDNDVIIGEACHVTLDRTFLLNLRDMLLMVIKGDSKINMPNIENIKDLTFEIYLTERIKAVKSIDAVNTEKQGIFIQQLGKTAFRLPEKTKKSNSKILEELIEKTGSKLDNKNASGFLLFSFSVEKIVF